VAAATLGRDGVLAWDGMDFHYAPAFEVSVRDTTGAGDVFHGAFLYTLFQKWPLARQLDFCCAAAALNCTAAGARGRIGRLQEIEELMRSGRRYEAAFPPGSLGA
jgi:sugar/nucleoside kinase (ribokinase family)